MIRLAVSVEGQTEEEFVKTVLAERLREKGVEPYPSPLNGNVTIERLTADMARLFWNFNAVTSLVDFYGFRDKGKRTVDELEEHLNREIQSKVRRKWDGRKIIPYVQKHEFEGLLFSDVTAFGSVLGTPERKIAQIESIRSQFATPEDINDNSRTAPSKRIAGVIPKYRKVVDGRLLAEDIGLAAIRAACPRFDAWVTRLESLKNPG